jgi:hypothetical protein
VSPAQSSVAFDSAFDARIDEPPNFGRPVVGGGSDKPLECLDGEPELATMAPDGAAFFKL